MPVTLTCERCGIKFSARKTPNRKERERGLFCGSRCRYVDRTTKGAKDRREARRAAAKGATFEPVDYMAVFERDGWRCWLCGNHTPKRLIGMDVPHAPTLDHVIPLSRGGPHCASNVRLACRHCNNARGNGTSHKANLRGPIQQGASSDP